MESYKILVFHRDVEIIEKFLTNIAANEDYLVSFGLNRALKFENAEESINALNKFGENFSRLKRLLHLIDRNAHDEIAHLDRDGRIVEQVALIDLKLRMLSMKKTRSSASASLRQFMILLPTLNIGKPKGLFDEEPVSLQKIIINLGRLRNIADSVYEALSNAEASDNNFFKPSNIDDNRLISMIDASITQIQTLANIPQADRERLISYLQEAKREAASTNPSWSKVIGALVIAAAITSGIADSSNAASNLQAAVKYILGTTIEKPNRVYFPPMENYTPPDENDNHEETEIDEKAHDNSAATTFI